MQFTSYNKAKEVAERTTERKLATERGFSGHTLVVIEHGDGTKLFFHSAALRTWRDWVIVFTEHHGEHVYHMTDLHSYGEYCKAATEALKDTEYRDKCERCGTADVVENLRYGMHPDHERHTEFVVLCQKCWKEEE